MAKLKYYKDFTSHGHTWTLGIYQETDEELTAIEIGPVLQGLRLVMQGEQADIDTPIVKTSLEMTFVDAPDLEEDRKCGFWEEFYTSSSTEYVVLLLKDNVHEWVGYITPDSFSEDLRYRGSVTLIARDGLGALQDYPFQIVGSTREYLSLDEIVNMAWNILPMKATLKIMPTGGSSLIAISKDGGNILNTRFNVSAFRDKTWLEVLEDVLYASGLSLRYEGRKTFVLRSIRQQGLAMTGYWWDTPILDARFCAYGHRELAPAAKAIKDALEFDIDENIIDSYTGAADYGTEEYTYNYEDPNGETLAMPFHKIVNGLYAPEETYVLDVFRYPIKGGYSYGPGGHIQDPDIIYFGANNSSRIPSVYTQGFTVELPPGQYKLSFEANKAIALYDSLTRVGYAYYENLNWSLSTRIRFEGIDGSYITINNVSRDGIIEPKWLDGYESTYAFRVEGEAFPQQTETPVLTVTQKGTLRFQVIGALLNAAPLYGAVGGYIGLSKVQLISVDNGGNAIMEQLRITTDYNSRNNIVLSRSPKYAPNPSKSIRPRMIKNGLFTASSGGKLIGSEQWVFHDTDTPQPLSVLIHQQLLSFYSKPNNVLTGELLDAGGFFPDFSSLWRWGGKVHMLTSGTLNILTGRMESAVLREFTRYDHMWETWIENEDIKVDYSNSRIEVIAHSNRKLSLDSISGLPSWVTRASIIIAGNKHIYTLNVMENASGQERSAIFRIDTAYMRITQSAAGDYNIDYGTDYS